MSEITNKDITKEKLALLPILGAQPKTEKEEKFLREICEYEFFNLEEPGLPLSFLYGDTRNKHTFTLHHGEKKKLPRFVARHVESKGTPIWKWKPDGSGSLIKNHVGRKPRFRMSQSFN